MLRTLMEKVGDMQEQMSHKSHGMDIPRKNKKEILLSIRLWVSLMQPVAA